jgi:hypothetical protein
MFDWLQDHPELLKAAVVGSVATFVGSLIGLPLLVARIPADYFAGPKPPPSAWKGERPLLRATVLVLKNGGGLVLVVAGIAMLVLPGQGILAILAGLTLLSFPKKRALELWFVRRSKVLGALNWIRKKAGKDALRVWRGGDGARGRSGSDRRA